MANKVSVELSANVQGFQKGMQDATNSAKQYETEQRKIADSLGNFKKEFGAAKREVMNLAQAYSKLDAEAKNSQFGREMAKQLEEAKQKAAEMLDMQGDLNQELKNMASDTRVFDTLSEGMNVFMNVTSAAIGTIALFTDDEKAAKEAVVMFTTAQSALNSMTAIANALQGQSNTMLAVRKVQELAATAAIKIRTAAEGKGIIATKTATVAQKAFNLVASANPYVLLATAIIGVATACYVFASKMSDAKEKEEQAQKAAEEAKKAFEKQRETMSQASVSFVETASKIENLREQYKSTNNQLQKTEILQQASKEFKNLGLQVNNLNDAQRLLVQDGDKVIELLKAQGEAAAIAAIRTEMFKEKFNDIMKSGKNTVADALRLTSHMLKDQLGDLDKEYIKLQTKVSALRKKLPQVSKSSGGSSKKTNTVDFDKGTLADYENQLNKLQTKLKNKNLSPIDLEKTKKDIKDLEKIIKAEKIRLGLAEPDPKDIEGTEAWFKNEIKKLEDKKAKLKLDAYVERDQLQQQIDSLNLKIKLETEGVTVTGNKDISKAFSGDFKHSMTEVGNMISALQQKVQDSDWSEMGKDGTKSLQDYIDKIQELMSIQEKLKESYDNNMMTPAEKAKEHFDNMMQKANETSDALSSMGSVTDAVGAMFKNMGDESTAAAMTVVTSTIDMIAQVLPQIISLIAAKQAEAMAVGTAGAAAMPFPASIAAIASIIATVIGTFASIWSALESHANGGIVGGSSYHGDKILTRLDSGEMVLNQRQQRNLFNMLDSNTFPQPGGTNVTVQGVIHGTDLLLVQKNTNNVRRRSGTKISF